MEWSDVEMERRDTTSGVENEMESHFLFSPTNLDLRGCLAAWVVTSSDRRQNTFGHSNPIQNYLVFM